MGIQFLDRFIIPDHVQFVAGNGGLAKAVVTSKAGAAEIYLHGAQVTHFQKNGEPPLIFLSRKSHFKSGQAIRGGVPIVFPWFGNRDGEPSHGFARISQWQLIETSAAEDSITLKFTLPEIPGREVWKKLRAEFVVTVADTLTMEFTAANESCGETLEFENCLHTYFQVGDIGAISIFGLETSPFDDFASGATGARRPAENSELKIIHETNRTYFDSPQTVEIRDYKLNRVIRVEKSGSNSTVVWNPWTTQKLPDDFDPAEYQKMICVESGNLKQNKISLAPGAAATLKVIVSSRRFG